MRRVTLFSFFIGAIFLTFLFSIGASAGVINPNDDIMTLLYTPKSLPVVESSLINLPPDNSVKIWVYFTDKNIFSNDDLTVALDNTKNALTDRALKRRAKTRGENVVDFRDISMNDDYIYQIETAGAEVKHRIKWLNAVSANVQVSDIRKIGALPFVRKIERVKSLGAELYEINTKSNLSPNPPVITESSYDYGVSESQLEQINVPPAHELGFNGEGIIICMLDVGYRKDHQAFVPAFDDGRVLAEWDFINNDGNTDLDQGDDPTQANHGTLCWSTLGGQAPGHLYGPSFGAFFILGKTEDVTSERHIEEDNWAAAALWADSIGAEVISASLGYRWFDPGEGDYEYEDLDGNTTIVTQAADLAAYNGITVCTANGNEGYMGPGSLIAPADGDSVIGCGAIDAYGEAAGFTSQGPTYDDRMKPEVNARGVGTDCADPYDMNGYTTANGTSLSTPLIGGASGVVLSAHPGWTPMMVREALMMTADRVDDPDNIYGWGTVNVMKAILYHPEGDVVFDYIPLYYASPDAGIDISSDITCIVGINSSSVTLYWNDDGSETFNSIPMDVSGDTYSAEIPLHELGDSLWYYIYAESNNGLAETYPIGAPYNSFIVEVSTPKFSDNFEQGPYYWETEGENAKWGLNSTESVSGNLSFTDSPQGNYGDNLNNSIVLRRPLDFTDASNPQLSFHHIHNLRTSGDFIYIEGSDDMGSSWTQIGDPINDRINDFEHEIRSLTDFAGSEHFLLRFRIETNASGSRDGWYVDDIEIFWDGTDVKDEEENVSLPGVFSLDGNYPNPFNAGTVIKFRTPAIGNVNLSVFNIAGQKVVSLFSGNMEAGAHQVNWNGTTADGQPLSSGVYFTRLEYNGSVKVSKMTLTK